MPFDPTGIDLKQQARAAYFGNRDAMRAQDYGAGGNAIDQAVHNTGPMPDPQWQGWFGLGLDPGDIRQRSKS